MRRLMMWLTERESTATFSHSSTSSLLSRSLLMIRHQLHHRHYRRPAAVSLQPLQRQTNATVSLLSSSTLLSNDNRFDKSGKSGHRDPPLPGGWSPSPAACATHDWTAHTHTHTNHSLASKAHIVPVNPVTILLMRRTTTSSDIQITMRAQGLTHELFNCPLTGQLNACIIWGKACDAQVCRSPAVLNLFAV